MSPSNYPPGVTGNEPQITGDGENTVLFCIKGKHVIKTGEIVRKNGHQLRVKCNEHPDSYCEEREETHE